jgi:hypothetical protein
LKTPKIGVEYDNSWVKSKTDVTADTKNPTLTMEASFRSNEDDESAYTAGHKTSVALKAPMNNMKTSMALVGHFNKNVQWGALMNAKTSDKGAFAVTDTGLYFNHTNDGNVMGANVNYDFATKKFASKMGLKLPQEDHTWKFRLHDSGLTKVAL